MIEVQRAVAGRPISAAEWNKVADLAKRKVQGPDVRETSSGYYVAGQRKFTTNWAYVVGLIDADNNPDEDGPKVLARPAIQDEVASEWLVRDDPDNQLVYRYDVPPGFQLQDFVCTVIKHQESCDYQINHPLVQGQPNPTDKAIMTINRFAVPPSAVTAAPPGFTRCKILDVDPVAQYALVLPVQPDPDLGEFFDPSIPIHWINNGNFGLPFCVWTMGLTHARARHPCIVFGGEGLGWMYAAVNMVGPNYARACEPQGPFAPTIDQQCDDPEPEDPDRFTDTFACLLPDGSCDELTLCECALEDGTPMVNPDNPNQYLSSCPPPTAAASSVERKYG